MLEDRGASSTGGFEARGKIFFASNEVLLLPPTLGRISRII
jgi:hypothetical protein